MFQYPSDDWASLNLEYVIRRALLNEDYEVVSGQMDKDISKAERRPRIVITKAKGDKTPISKPGVSIKHGKLADQHPAQREAYDQAYESGYEAAMKALVGKAKDEQDVYYSAQRHERRGRQAIGIESSRHAGLAKGAKMAAYQYSIKK